MAEQSLQLQAIALDHDGQDFRWTVDSDERSSLWAARHKAYYALSQQQPGKGIWTVDVCVPFSRLAESILRARSEIDASPLAGAILGHVGDGNLFVALLADPGDPAEMAEAERLNSTLVHSAIAAGGTCTGEHGIGYAKINHLTAELGEGVDIMRMVKTALDPHNLLNPGKMVTISRCND
jgi:D-lactate dehydrogenase (cytochrome)